MPWKLLLSGTRVCNIRHLWGDCSSRIWLLAHTPTVGEQSVHFGYGFLQSVLRRPPLAMHDEGMVAP
jgi:hypothetical protein